MAVAAATFGGIARDLLIGDVPPAALVDWRYFAAAIAAGTLSFVAGVIRLNSRGGADVSWGLSSEADPTDNRSRGGTSDEGLRRARR